MCPGLNKSFMEFQGSFQRGFFGLVGNFSVLQSVVKKVSGDFNVVLRCFKSIQESLIRILGASVSIKGEFQEISGLLLEEI